MIRSLLSAYLLMLLATPAMAQSASGAPPATYILQVSSNLECSGIEVELVPRGDRPKVTLSFDDQAYSAVTLEPGTYAFGPVSCLQDDQDARVFDSLVGSLQPISVTSGQAYFGGTLIIEEDVSDAIVTPDIVDNCVRGTGRFRKEPRDECRDGTGIDGSAKRSALVNFYTPYLSDEELARVRSAFAADPEQLRYLPLTVQGS